MLAHKAARILRHTCFTMTFFYTRMCLPVAYKRLVASCIIVAFPVHETRDGCKWNKCTKGIHYYPSRHSVLRIYFTYSRFSVHNARKFRLSYYISICHIAACKMLNFRNLDLIEYFYKNNTRAFFTFRNF